MRITRNVSLAAVGLWWSLFAPMGYSQTTEPALLGTLVDVGGYRIHIYCTGQGSPTVIVASGGFSFDWGLVQPRIAQSTQICTYDTAGTAWSDQAPEQNGATCAYRVEELHKVLSKGGVRGPYVLVGFSLVG